MQMLLQNITHETLLQAICFLFLLDFILYLPFFRVAFSGAEYEDFKASKKTKAFSLGTIWALGLFLIFLQNPISVLSGLFILTLIFRHFYINQRWKSVRRGFGAPGFMSHYMVRYLFLFELSHWLDPSTTLTQTVLLAFKIDFAFIMLCAGIYKLLSGYLHGEGMDYGRVNPFWGYHWKNEKKDSPYSIKIRVLNFLGSVVEIIAGIFMLIPATEVLGALAISLSFLFVATQIRLGRLAFLMTLIPFYYFPSAYQSLLTPRITLPTFLQLSDPVVMLLQALLYCYIFLIPVIKVMQYLNLFFNKTYPQPLQTVLSKIANWVPIIMWRVFTPDVTNFYIKIFAKTKNNTHETPLLTEENYSLKALFSKTIPLKNCFRFWHVTESIALTSIFTTLRYFPSQPELFQKKLLHYSKSLQDLFHESLESLRFEYYFISKTPNEYTYQHVGDFNVHLESQKIIHHPIDPKFDWHKPAKNSPVKESKMPGTLELKTK